MAEALVSFLISKLAEFLQEEEKLLGGFRAEVEYISDELEFMKAFLRVADAMEENDPVLKVLVKKVRDVAYDMEDALDNFRLHLANDQRRGFFGSARKLYFSVKKLTAKRQIATRLQSIKARVISISEAHRRYLIKNNIIEQGLNSNRLPRLECQGDALLLEEADLVGIDVPKSQLIGSLLAEKAERNIFSVVGMGGLGKSTLVKKVYDDSEVKKNFKFRAWITVSQSFKMEDLLKDMIHQLFRAVKKPVPEEVESMNNDQLRQRIKKFLQSKRYLIILDDVWQIAAWDAVKLALPSNNHGSRVLLTTRDAEVANSSCIDSSNVFHMKPLSLEDSQTLLCRKIFQEDSCPLHLKDVSESILKRCEGLPLAIVAISGVLATKDKMRIDEWQMISLSLGAELEDNDKLKNTRKILSLSYSHLPYYLKSCLLYFSIFPEGTLIQHMRLVRLWIAEGFVKDKEGMTLEEVAEDYLNELIKRNLVQIVEATSYGRVKTCRIHDLLREIILSRSRDEDFVAISKDESMIWPEKIRRLSVHNATGSTEWRMSSGLRSLLMFWGVDSSSMESPPSFTLYFGGLKLLNVLDLEGAPLRKFPPQVVKLILLKYLNLRNTKVDSVPSTIGELQNLESFDLKHSLVSELPVDILKLKKLRHLLVYRHEVNSDNHTHRKYGFKAPSQIGNLNYLQKLCFLESDRNLMTQVGRLNGLRRLGVVNLRKEDGKLLCSSIEMLTNLRALSINSVQETEVIEIHYLSTPPPFLQRLYLTGRLIEFPEWISSLNNLAKLLLKSSRLRDDPLAYLQYLPNLVHLEFIQFYEGEELLFQAKGFKRLKFMGLNKVEGLVNVIIEQGAMPSLEKLIFQSCKSLQRVPLGIEHLTDLKVLEFIDMPKELIMALHPDEEDGDYKKVAHVPEIYYTYWNNGNLDIFSLESFREDKNSAHPSTTTTKRDLYVWK
ncbi:hypothetical protein K2173_002850 [Erythroxylum novogranatense]|uniref:Uncharacterized protein n=1 Tax=Erythroxylum novogranatense TaxID=1862640 RepID=A0AAV8SQX2_9ROSI|nr:hypothetical protein K2173_002850 [Erythroxylum novogranatense]